MSASFCDCVNQWEKKRLQMLKDTKYLSVRKRCDIYSAFSSTIASIQIRYPMLGQEKCLSSEWNKWGSEILLANEDVVILMMMTLFVLPRPRLRSGRVFIHLPSQPLVLSASPAPLSTWLVDRQLLEDGGYKLLIHPQIENCWGIESNCVWARVISSGHFSITGTGTHTQCKEIFLSTGIIVH